MVPIREMTDVMKIVKEQASLKAKQWVRLKRGLYRDDLAQVGHRVVAMVTPAELALSSSSDKWWRCKITLINVHICLHTATK